MAQLRFLRNDLHQTFTTQINTSWYRSSVERLLSETFRDPTPVNGLKDVQMTIGTDG